MKTKVAGAFCTLFLAFLVFSMRVDAHTFDVPSDNSFKTYMSYKAITNTSSKQYAMQQQSVTDANGIRMYNGRYCIAVGTYYAKEIGVPLDVTLANGTVLHCVTGEAKKDIHTDSTHRQVAKNGNVIEFIIDPDVLDTAVRNSGDISTIPGFEGEIVSISLAEAAAPLEVTPRHLPAKETVKPPQLNEPLIIESQEDTTPKEETPEIDSSCLKVISKYELTIGDDTLYFIDANILETHAIDKSIYDNIVPGETILKPSDSDNGFTIL